MLEPRIQQQFFESADLVYQCAEPLSRPVADAAQALVGGLTAGGRILVAGLGRAAALAQLMAQALAGRYERERPGLAAMALGTDAVLLAALAADGSADAALARQVEALGQPGDVLLLIDHDGHHPAVVAAAVAAQGQEMTVIALVGRAGGAASTEPAGGALAAVLGETDVLVAVPHERRARVLEAQLLVLHCLCDAIDLQLLGETEPE